MSLFPLISGIIQLMVFLMKISERNQIISDTENLERAKVIAKINESLVEASRIPLELRGLNEKELDEYVQNKGWYRD